MRLTVDDLCPRLRTTIATGCVYCMHHNLHLHNVMRLWSHLHCVMRLELRRDCGRLCAAPVGPQWVADSTSECQRRIIALVFELLERAPSV